MCFLESGRKLCLSHPNSFFASFRMQGRRYGKNLVAASGCHRRVRFIVGYLKGKEITTCFEIIQDSFPFAIYFHGFQVHFYAGGDILAHRQRHPHKMPMVPAQDDAEAALRIYKTFLNNRTCMRRAPDRPVSVCTLRLLRPVSHIKFAAILRRNSHYSLQSSHSTLHTSHCTLRNPDFTSHGALIGLHTWHFTLQTSQSTLHTSLFKVHSSHCTPHTSHSTLHLV